MTSTDRFHEKVMCLFISHLQSHIHSTRVGLFPLYPMFILYLYAQQLVLVLECVRSKSDLNFSLFASLCLPVRCISGGYFTGTLLAGYINTQVGGAK